MSYVVKSNLFSFQPRLQEYQIQAGDQLERRFCYDPGLGEQVKKEVRRRSVGQYQEVNNET